MQLVYLVAFTEAQCERAVVERLADLNYWPYMPVERYWSRHFKSIRDRPLFPRYVFVGVDIEGREEAPQWLYRPIGSTRGVRELLTSDGRHPGMVAPEMIEGMRSAERVGIFDATPQARLKPGDKVRVDGPFGDLIGTIKSASNRKRVEILFSILGTERIVQAPLSKVERV